MDKTKFANLMQDIELNDSNFKKLEIISCYVSMKFSHDQILTLLSTLQLSETRIKVLENFIENAEILKINDVLNYLNAISSVVVDSMVRYKALKIILKAKKADLTEQDKHTIFNVFHNTAEQESISKLFGLNSQPSSFISNPQNETSSSLPDIPRLGLAAPIHYNGIPTTTVPTAAGYPQNNMAVANTTRNDLQNSTTSQASMNSYPINNLYNYNITNYPSNTSSSIPPADNSPTTYPPSVNPATTYPPSVNPATTYPPSVNPSTTYPSSVNPETTYPPSVNPATTYPPSVNPSATYPPSVNPATTYPPSVNPSATTYPSSVNPSATYPPSVNPATTYPPSVNPATTYPASVNPYTTYPPSVNPSKTYPPSVNPFTTGYPPSINYSHPNYSAQFYNTPQYNPPYYSPYPPAMSDQKQTPPPSIGFNVNVPSNAASNPTSNSSYQPSQRNIGFEYY